MKSLQKLDAEEKDRAVTLLKDLKGSVDDVLPLVKQLQSRQKAGELDMSKGISFLDVKNHQMLSYLINLSHLMLQKCQGKSIQNSPDVDRLVEIRTVLEKMRPTEQKLKYQIDKLVGMGSGMARGEGDPLSLKPNPSKLLSKLEDEDNSDSNDEDSDKADDDSKRQVYKVAKVVPMFYDGDETARQKQERLLERKKKRMANTSVMKDLHRQYTDGPEEIRDAVGVNRAKESKRERERREYEETYFQRKSLTKKELHAERRMRTTAGLNDITSFPDFSLFGESDETKLPGSRKRSASATKSKKGSKKKRKFRK